MEMFIQSGANGHVSFGEPKSSLALRTVLLEIRNALIVSVD
jgi:hypothetical protein